MTANLLIPKGGTLKLGPTATALAVECQVSRCVASATPDPKTFTGLCGKTTVPGITAWVLNIDYAQDWSEGGLSTYLANNDGQLVDFEYAPLAADSPKVAGRVWIVPGDFGGEAGEIATATIALGIDGAPTFTPTPAAPLAAKAAKA